MKKVAKSGVLLLIMGVILVLLTGCGGSKLVATKTTEDDTFGSYEERIEITFKNKKANEIKMIMKYEKEETASGMYGLLSMSFSMADEKIEGIDIKQDGKKVLITMKPEMFAEQEGLSDEDMTKEALKTSLEEDGYTVK